jgi:hypothetical protein
MAVAVELSYNGPGATRANYDQLLQQLGVSPEGRHPDPDLSLPLDSETPGGGFRVTDVGQVRRSSTSSSRTRLGPSLNS